MVSLSATAMNREQAFNTQSLEKYLDSFGADKRVKDDILRYKLKLNQVYVPISSCRDEDINKLSEYVQSVTNRGSARRTWVLEISMLQ